MTNLGGNPDKTVIVDNLARTDNSMMAWRRWLRGAGLCWPSIVGFGVVMFVFVLISPAGASQPHSSPPPIKPEVGRTQTPPMLAFKINFANFQNQINKLPKL